LLALDRAHAKELQEEEEAQRGLQYTTHTLYTNTHTHQRKEHLYSRFLNSSSDYFFKKEKRKK
jgi:hypothetical protein